MDISKNYTIVINESHTNEIITNCVLIHKNNKYVKIIFPTFVFRDSKITPGIDKSNKPIFRCVCSERIFHCKCSKYDSYVDSLGKNTQMDNQFDVYKIKIANNMSFPYINPAVKFESEKFTNIPFNNDFSNFVDFEKTNEKITRDQLIQLLV